MREMSVDGSKDFRGLAIAEKREACAGGKSSISPGWSANSPVGPGGHERCGRRGAHGSRGGRSRPVQASHYAPRRLDECVLRTCNHVALRAALPGNRRTRIQGLRPPWDCAKVINFQGLAWRGPTDFAAVIQGLNARPRRK